MSLREEIMGVQKEISKFFKYAGYQGQSPLPPHFNCVGCELCKTDQRIKIDNLCRVFFQWTGSLYFVTPTHS